MYSVPKRKFDWDAANRKHLAAHDVTPQEFEQIFEHPLVEAAQYRNHEERVWCLGRTDAGRLLTAVYTLQNGVTRPVTAHTTKRKYRNLYAKAIESTRKA